MGELIATIPTSPAGMIALEHLASRATEVGCEYLRPLAREVEGLEAQSYLGSLPFTFHLLRTEDGGEASAINRIRRWHSGEVRDWPRGRVEDVEPNWPLYPLAPLGLPFRLGGDHQRYRGMMRVDDAHADGLRGAEVRIAILDSGLDPAAKVPAQDFIDLENVQQRRPPAPIDADGHGTAMAELVHDVAPDAAIFVVRVLATGRLNLWNLLAGVGVAVTDCRADIVNLSLGFSSLSTCGVCGAAVAIRSLAFEKLAQAACPGAAAAPVHVAAAGNAGSTGGFDFPASSAACVAVGSVDTARRRSAFSSYGTAHPRYLLAPGGQGAPGAFTESVGTGGHGTPCAGTSVSAAYVSAMLAVFRGDPRYALLGREQFLDAVLANHCALPPHAAGTGLEYGSGIIGYDPVPTPPAAGQAAGTGAGPASGGPGGAGAGPPPGPAIWSDGTYVYVGGVRLRINRRFS